MKIKTKDLFGPALNWAVAKCEGKNITLMRNDDGSLFPQPVWADGLWQQCYSSSWSQGGPLIEREGIQLFVNRIIETTESGIEIDERDGWKAYRTGRYWQTQPAFFGSTPLIAAMRCYVASNLGDEVDVPNELMEN